MAEKKSKVGVVMHEFKAGKLRSGSKKGPKVKSRKQALAIGLSEARKAGENVPWPPKKKVGRGEDVGYLPDPLSRPRLGISIEGTGQQLWPGNRGGSTGGDPRATVPIVPMTPSLNRQQSPKKVGRGQSTGTAEMAAQVKPVYATGRGQSKKKMYPDVGRGQDYPGTEPKAEFPRKPTNKGKPKPTNPGVKRPAAPKKRVGLTEKEKMRKLAFGVGAPPGPK